jgi:hypothetical protein
MHLIYTHIPTHMPLPTQKQNKKQKQFFFK